jgi:rRNA maturation protein Nop10
MSTFKKAEPQGSNELKEICQRCGRIVDLDDIECPPVGWYDVEVIEHLADEDEEDSLVICDVCGGALEVWMHSCSPIVGSLE